VKYQESCVTYTIRFMKPDNELIGILNDLIRINHDRAGGYNKAIEELRAADIDLRTLFVNTASASAQNAGALADEVRDMGGTPVSESTPSGKLYRIWMDIRSGISTGDRKSILSLCEFGEDAALKTYKLALESDIELPVSTHELITEQQSGIQHTHDIVKRYRDMQETRSHDVNIYEQ
jgi:uncharacterized protein (TIGR02284 family)